MNTKTQTREIRSEYTANGMMAIAPARQGVLLENNGWKVGKNFFATSKKRVIINPSKQTRK